MVNLTHEQTTADVKGDIQGRSISTRHVGALHGHIGTVIGYRGHGGVEEEGQEGT